jgi:hypothetical protein
VMNIFSDIRMRRLIWTERKGALPFIWSIQFKAFRQPTWSERSRNGAIASHHFSSTSSIVVRENHCLQKRHSVICDFTGDWSETSQCATLELLCEAEQFRCESRFRHWEIVEISMWMLCKVCQRLLSDWSKLSWAINSSLLLHKSARCFLNPLIKWSKVQFRENVSDMLKLSSLIFWLIQHIEFYKEHYPLNRRDHLLSTRNIMYILSLFQTSIVGQLMQQQSECKPVESKKSNHKQLNCRFEWLLFWWNQWMRSRDWRTNIVSNGRHSIKTRRNTDPLNICCCTDS